MESSAGDQMGFVTSPGLLRIANCKRYETTLPGSRQFLL